MDTLDKIIDFVDRIGINVEEKELSAPTFLPGLMLTAHGIVIDRNKLAYPGDVLHEAGHLAVTTPDMRSTIGTVDFDVSWPTDGEEIAAVLWSYAAALHIGIPIEIVFHSNGYKGQSGWLIENFNSGNYIGLPLLEWMGLTLPAGKAKAFGKQPFPEMVQWMRK